jgi:hypothetical protein
MEFEKKRSKKKKKKTEKKKLGFFLKHLRGYGGWLSHEWLGAQS